MWMYCRPGNFAVLIFSALNLSASNILQRLRWQQQSVHAFHLAIRVRGENFLMALIYVINKVVQKTTVCFHGPGWSSFRPHWQDCHIRNYQEIRKCGMCFTIHPPPLLGPVTHYIESRNRDSWGTKMSWVKFARPLSSSPNKNSNLSSSVWHD